MTPTQAQCMMAFKTGCALLYEREGVRTYTIGARRVIYVRPNPTAEWKLQYDDVLPSSMRYRWRLTAVTSQIEWEATLHGSRAAQQAAKGQFAGCTPELVIQASPGTVPTGQIYRVLYVKDATTGVITYGLETGNTTDERLR